MKNTATIVLFAVLLVSCVEPIGEEVKGKQVGYTPDRGYPINEYTFDGCQYIGRISGDASSFTHKGNCNNPIHRCPCNSVDSSLIEKRDAVPMEELKIVP
jgi:hypothetical protein